MNGRQAERQRRYRKLTLLHSNDIHGDFFEEENKGKYTGGISSLSAYVQSVREEEEQVLYLVAGDMLQGSVIDQEYRGLSTIDLMNMLAPDIATVGNHEMDYGLAHLLFLERCAKFPIVNANLYVKPTDNRLFRPYQIIEKDGIKVLIIGVITEDIIELCPSDPLITNFVRVTPAEEEIERICNAYRAVDIDFTVVLTHVGLEEDIRLAERINPALGIDLIIGGHSHSFMQQPIRVNDILIAHAGHGSDQIGRFDIVVDMENNCIAEYSWDCVTIDGKGGKDRQIDEMLELYREKVDEKYSLVLTRMKRRLSHPSRERETELGNLFADILAESFHLDLFIVGSGSVRKEYLDAVVTKRMLKEVLPFNDPIYCFRVSGAKLGAFIRSAFERFHRGETREFYQYSSGIELIYDAGTKQVKELLFRGESLDAEKIYTIGMQEYHYVNSGNTAGIDLTLTESGQSAKLLSTGVYDTVEEYFSVHQQMDARIEGRIREV